MSKESDEKVINTFVGNYTANGKFKSPSLPKDPWFPPKGLKLTLRKVDLGSDQVGAKVRLEPPLNTHFQSKAAMEAATYRVKGDKLLAEKLPFGSTLTADETLEMKDGEMLHFVKFSDNEEGNWTCPPDKS